MYDHTRVKAAFERGLPVQFKNSNGEWFAATTPTWDADIEFRINPLGNYTDTTIKTQAQLDALTPEKAKAWLLEYDKEGTAIWEAMEPSNQLIEEVKENIRDFGFQTDDGLPLTETSSEPQPEPITRDQFMAYFRSDAFNEEMSADDCVEIFLGSLKGQSDITKRLLETLCHEYGTKLDHVLSLGRGT